MSFKFVPSGMVPASLSRSHSLKFRMWYIETRPSIFEEENIYSDNSSLLPKEVSKMSKNKIQALLINHLNKYGNIELILPDGVVLEIGVNQEDKNGDIIIADDYCWVIASRKDKSAVLDSYNLGLRFNDDSRTIVFEDKYIDQNGDQVRRLDVV